MPRPITLFTGQWADLPLPELAGKAAEWGFNEAFRTGTNAYRTLAYMPWPPPLSAATGSRQEVSYRAAAA